VIEVEILGQKTFLLALYFWVLAPAERKARNFFSYFFTGELGRLARSIEQTHGHASLKKRKKSEDL
jgi:hypothetical protein